jgi:predicted nucleotidyltransferase
MQVGPEHKDLQALCPRLVSRRYYRHYRGFANQQRQSFENAETPTVKKLLYAFRTALTGIHLLRTGELLVDLRESATLHGFTSTLELVEAKKSGEHSTMSADAAQGWSGELERVFGLLDRAHEESHLPEQAPGREQASAWLVDVRRRHF